MATCKDCMHYDLCRSCSRIQLGWNVNTVGYVENVEEICKHFADSSRFVELPCRVSGDCFFVNQNGTIQRATLERVYMFSTSTELFLNDGREIYSTSLNESNIELFPTYEEAEQALKERESNG